MSDYNNTNPSMVQATQRTRAQIRTEKRDLKVAMKNYRNLQQSSGTSKRVSDSVLNDMIYGLGKVVMVWLLLFAMISALTGREQNLTFSGLLNALSNAPTIDIASIFKDMNNLYIDSDWSDLFNWLRDFLNQFVMPIISVVVYYCLCFAQLAVYLIWFIGFLFGF